MNRVILLVICYFLPLWVLANSPEAEGRSTTVEGDIYLSVDRKHVKANLNYRYVASEDSVSEISFYLTNEVNIDQLEGESIETYTFDKEAKPFATLTIIFKQPIAKGTTTQFTLAYSGALSKGFWTEQYGWIDIDPDFMILPLFTNFSHFDYQIHAELVGSEYRFVDVRKNRMSPTLDIDAESVFYFESIVAGDDMRFDRYTEGENALTIISNKPDSVLNHLGNKGIEILEYFNRTIGENSEVNSFTVLYRPLPDSIFRTIRSLPEERFIMFSSNHERIPTLAHEISHFWWNRANDFSMEKWLDESFAEYSKLMYLRDFHVREEFQERIALLAQEVKELPSMLNSDRFGKHGNSLLYKKGPYLLYQLEENIGREKFTQLLTILNEREVATTEDMLNELERISGLEQRESFEEKLIN